MKLYLRAPRRRPDDTELAKAPRSVKIARDPAQPDSLRRHPYVVERAAIKPAVRGNEIGKAHLKELFRGLQVTVGGRYKEQDSLIDKLHAKDRQVRPASHERGLSDIVGLRVTAHNPEHYHEAIRRVREHMRTTPPSSQTPHERAHGIGFHAEEDFNETPRGDAKYRAVHFDGHAGGVPAELQVRQHHQSVWSKWFHPMYKPKELVTKRGIAPEHHESIMRVANQYAAQVSDHLERTRGKAGPDFPKPPPEIAAHPSLHFPVHKLDEREEVNVPQGDEPVSSDRKG